MLAAPARSPALPTFPKIPPQTPPAVPSPGEERPSRPRRVPPPPRAAAAGVLGLSPLLFFVLLITGVFAAGIGLLLWSSPDDGYELTLEERAVLMTPPEPRSALPPTDGFPARVPVRTTVELWVDSDPSGSDVLIDYKEAGRTPFYTDRLSTGWYALSLEMEGYVPRDTFLYLSADRINEIALDLAPLRPASRSAPRARDPQPEANARTPRPTPPDSDAEHPATGTVRINVAPAGAVVQLDGDTAGLTPLRKLDVAPGRHTLSFSLDGYEPLTTTVEVLAGESTTVTATLKPLPGTLSVRVNPWGSVYVDGTLRARDTDLRQDLSLPPGAHRVRVVHPELGAQEQEVQVRPGQVTSLLFDLNRRSP